ncbi:MAG: cytochrome C [Leptospirillia bacterium]
MRSWFHSAVTAFLTVTAVLAMPVGASADGKGEALLAERCAGCHNLDGTTPETLAALLSRKGPDLSFAGNKYRAGWIAEWLTEPSRIRPAGMFYGNHLKAGEKWDQVDTAALSKHPVLSKGDAESAAAALMTRTPRSAQLAGIEVKKVSLSLMMGDLMFDKFKGCIACHQSGPDYGGFSGPELYTAAERLTPEYMYSYMKSPQVWDPGIWMPDMGLSETDLNKLVRYLTLIAEAEE